MEWNVKVAGKADVESTAEWGRGTVASGVRKGEYDVRGLAWIWLLSDDYSPRSELGETAMDSLMKGSEAT